MTKDRKISRKPIRRAKLAVALLAATAAFSGGAQAVAPATASAEKYYAAEGCQGFLGRNDFWGWVNCETGTSLEVNFG